MKRIIYCIMTFVLVCGMLFGAVGCRDSENAKVRSNAYIGVFQIYKRVTPNGNMWELMPYENVYASPYGKKYELETGRQYYVEIGVGGGPTFFSYYDCQVTQRASNTIRMEQITLTEEQMNRLSPGEERGYFSLTCADPCEEERIYLHLSTELTTIEYSFVVTFS